MKTLIEVKDLEELKAILKKIHQDFKTIECKFYTYDYRTGCDTYLITIDGRAVGYSNGQLK